MYTIGKKIQDLYYKTVNIVNTYTTAITDIQSQIASVRTLFTSNYNTINNNMSSIKTECINQVSVLQSDLLNQNITFNNYSTNGTNKTMTIRQYIDNAIYTNYSPKIGLLDNECKVTVQGISATKCKIAACHIYLGGYYSYFPGKEIAIVANAINYIYFSRNTSDSTAIDINVYQEQKIDPKLTQFSRICVAKVVTNGTNVTATETYKISPFVSLTDRIAALEAKVK